MHADLTKEAAGSIAGAADRADRDTSHRDSSFTSCKRAWAPPPDTVSARIPYVRPDSNDIRIPVGAVPGTVPTGDLGDLGDLGEATPCRSSYIMGTWSAPVPCCARRPTTDGLNVMPSMRPRPADVRSHAV